MGMKTLEYLTLGQVAEQLGCQLWKVQRLFERRICQEAGRLGKIRVVTPDQVETIRKEMVKAGYLK
jgi:hypothetical protein